MTRRRQSAFEDMIEIAALLPWWVAIILAVISYFIIHPFAIEEVPPIKVMEGMGEMIGKQAFTTIAIFLQYIIPTAFTSSAFVSAIKQRQRSRIFNKQTSLKSISELSQIDKQHNEQQREQSPLCPKCGDEMLKKIAKKGPNAGNQFWRCSTFPECKGIVEI